MQLCGRTVACHLVRLSCNLAGGVKLLPRQRHDKHSWGASIKRWGIFYRKIWWLFILKTALGYNVFYDR